MTTEQWPALLVAIGGVLATIGWGIKWLINLVEARIRVAAESEKEAREKLADRLNEEIRLLRIELSLSQKDKSLYLRRIYMLETFIHKQPGIDIPTMEGWPPE